MRYAVIENGIVTNTILAEAIEASLHPEWVATETALVGDSYNAGEFEPVRLPPDPSVVPRTWMTIDIRSKLSLTERVKWDNNKTETIVTAKVEFETPRTQAETEEILQMLVDAGDISANSVARIMQG